MPSTLLVNLIAVGICISYANNDGINKALVAYPQRRRAASCISYLFLFFLFFSSVLSFRIYIYAYPKKGPASVRPEGMLQASLKQARDTESHENKTQTTKLCAEKSMIQTPESYNVRRQRQGDPSLGKSPRWARAAGC